METPSFLPFTKWPEKSSRKEGWSKHAHEESGARNGTAAGKKRVVFVEFPWREGGRREIDRPIRIPEKWSVPDSVTSSLHRRVYASCIDTKEEEEEEKRGEGWGEGDPWLRAYAWCIARVGVRESACSHVHNRVLYWACVIAPLSRYTTRPERIRVSSLSRESWNHFFLPSLA